MARRLQFAVYAGAVSRPGERRLIPNEFAASLDVLRRLQYRSEFTVTEAPAPSRLAPFGYAQTVDVEFDGHLVGNGRLVILHDPAGQPSWEGTIRVVSYVDADVDLEVASDPMLTDVGWSWLAESLAEAEAPATALGGTVTQVFSQSFGVMSSRAPEGRLQVRSSWTPTQTEDLVPHVRAWALLTAAACGLAPASDGVARLSRRP